MAEVLILQLTRYQKKVCSSLRCICPLVRALLTVSVSKNYSCGAGSAFSKSKQGIQNWRSLLLLFDSDLRSRSFAEREGHVNWHLCKAKVGPNLRCTVKSDDEMLSTVKVKPLKDFRGSGWGRL